MKTRLTIVLLTGILVAGAVAAAVWMDRSSHQQPHLQAIAKPSGAAAPPAVAETGLAPAAGRVESAEPAASKKAEPPKPAKDDPSPASPAKSDGQLGPRLVLKQQDYDFGRMETNNVGQHEFLLANVGDQPLTLKQGKSSCGCCTCMCETLLPEGGVMAPGQSAVVALKWTIKQFTGAFFQTSVLLTNDPAQPEVALGVSGRLTPAVKVVPWQLIFSRVSAGQEAVGEVRLYGYQSESLQISNRQWSDPSASQHFEAALSPLPPDEVAAEQDAISGFLLRVTVKPGLPLGPFQQRIVLATNVESALTVEVPIEGAVASDISIVGVGWDAKTGVLKLPAAAAVGKGAERKLLLVVRGPHRENVKFKLAQVTPDRLEAALGETMASNSGELTQTPLTIRWPTEASPGDRPGPPAQDTGQIVLDTNHPQQPQLRIQVGFAH